MNGGSIIRCNIIIEIIMNTSRIYQTIILFFLSVPLFSQNNNALNFGSGKPNYVAIPTASQINFGTSTNFTIEAWVKLYGSQSWTGIIAKADDANWYQFLIVDNHIAAELNSGSTFAGNIWGTTNLNDGNWHHLAMVVTRSTTNAKLYVDGLVEYNEDTGFNGNLDNSGEMLLGSSRGNANRFNGSIDEVRVWNTARSQAEIQNNMNVEVDPSSGLVAYYRFNQGIAGGNNAGVNTLTDLTSSGNNGTLYNFDLNGSSSNWVAANNSALPVELVSFTASTTDKKITLNWQTATEVNNYGFEIERIAVSDKLLANSQQLNTNSWVKIGFIQGHGNSNSPKNYSFTDNLALAHNLNLGHFQYRLKQIDLDGQYEYSDVVNVTFATPTNFAVEQNFPNPFNPTTNIQYQVSNNSNVTLKVYDALGKEVATLVNEAKVPGKYEVKFDGSNLSSGIYFYKLTAGNYFSIKKLILLK
jgi:hypothetical protein